jgi:hypothetical protein
LSQLFSTQLAGLGQLTWNFFSLPNRDQKQLLMCDPAHLLTSQLPFGLLVKLNSTKT